MENNGEGNSGAAGATGEQPCCHRSPGQGSGVLLGMWRGLSVPQWQWAGPPLIEKDDNLKWGVETYLKWHDLHSLCGSICRMLLRRTPPDGATKPKKTRGERAQNLNPSVAPPLRRLALLEDLPLQLLCLPGRTCSGNAGAWI